ncbi:hypothetical protein RCL_jg8414.t1 [Rhizophagus clarus]|uniref:Uncharacterized protein n=1 Tax=Rhizophagus clarus TaxID=94130 RepID=A0A8H3MI70_9GLOM|nr:hypothetical protein RCL_jg8414.t1 [Rhizophagus clarus]
MTQPIAPKDLKPLVFFKKNKNFKTKKKTLICTHIVLISERVKVFLAELRKSGTIESHGTPVNDVFLDKRQTRLRTSSWLKDINNEKDGLKRMLDSVPEALPPMIGDQPNEDTQSKKMVDEQSPKTIIDKIW